MQCSNCQKELSAGDRFCDACGAHVELVCASCGRAHAVDARFCAQCGARLPMSAGSLPPLRAERRNLSVMFCDLVGSTPLSSRLDPEDLGEIIRGYQSTVAAIIERFGGFIARYVGDGLLVYFGWPQAREADAERAIRAALAVVAAIDQSLISGERLQVRVGIATGLVVVGEPIGAGESRQQTAIGETPNRAARLQALAEPNGVVIDAATRQQVGGLFNCRSLGAVTLKGLPTPVRAWAVQSESAMRSRFEALHPMALTPLISREEEVNLLLRRWRQAARGEGKVVLIAGEAGIGKSRLLAALEEQIAGESCARLRYFCSPYHQDSPLHPIIEQLEFAAAFVRDDTAAAKLGKLRWMAAETGTSDEDVALLAGLLSIPTDNQLPSLDFSPQRLRERTFEALIRQLEALARQKPVLMLVEDLHWADPSSRELLDLVTERMSEMPVLLVMTYRLEFQAPWIGRAGVSVLTLGRLDRRETAQLVIKVAARVIAPDLIERIVEQTDGVPLFVEELTRTVLEGDSSPPAGSQRFGVPETLQASLLERLDRLPEAKSVAQIGSVIGRSFSYELISAVAEMPKATLRADLEQLVSAGLVLARGVPPEASFTFKHALVQDAAYESLLRGRRAALHARVAEVLCTEQPGTGQSEPELLAHHFEQAGLIEQAATCSTSAGRHSALRGAFTEASRLFNTALRLIETFPDSNAKIQAELRALTGLNAAVQYAAGYGSAERDRLAAREAELCALVPNPLDFLYTFADLWSYYLSRCDFANVLLMAERLVRWGNEGDDLRGQILGHLCAGSALALRGDLTEAHVRLELTIGLCESSYADPNVAWDQLSSPNALANAHSHLARVLCWMGYPDQALAHMSAADTEVDRGQFSVAGVAYFRLQRLRLFAHFFEPSELSEAADEVLRLNRELVVPYHVANAKIYKGYIVAHSDDPYAGSGMISEGLAEYRATNAIVFSSYYLALLAETLQMRGDTEAALTALIEALSTAERTGERWYEADLLRRIGEVHLAKHDPTAAERHFTQSLGIARSQSAKLFELRAATSMARLWCDQGRKVEAHGLLAPVLAWFTEGFATPDLKRAQALLDRLAPEPA